MLASRACKYVIEQKARSNPDILSSRLHRQTGFRTVCPRSHQNGSRIDTSRRERSERLSLTLKDADAQIRAVFFGGTTQFRQWNLKEGDRLEAYGNLSVYAARGEYQFNIRMIRPCGIGELQ